MHTTHVSSGGRYPVLRSLAIMYLFAAVGVVILGVWQAVNVFVRDTPPEMFGAATGMSGKILVAVSWLAASFIGALTMLGVAELMKLFIDMEHNTRISAMRSAATSAGIVAADGAPISNGNGTASIDGVGGRMGQWLEGEETAEGALLRGH